MSLFLASVMPSSHNLVDRICSYLRTKDIGNVKTFSDGEILAESIESVRGEDVYVVQSGVYPVNDTLLATQLMINALVDAEAESVTAIIPNLPYARQEKKTGRESLSSRHIAKCLQAAGAKRIVVVDVHNPAVQCAYDIPLINLSPNKLFAKWIVKNYHDPRDIVVASPDAGSLYRAKELAYSIAREYDEFGPQETFINLAAVIKQRPEAEQVSSFGTIGDVYNKVVIIRDDMTSTGKTLENAARALKENHAREVIACITHIIPNSEGQLRVFDIVDNGSIDDIVTTNSTVLVGDEHNRVIVIDLSRYLSDVVSCLHSKGSISNLL